MYDISRKIKEKFINRKSMKQDEKYTVPFPMDISNPNLVVIGTPGSGKCRMPLRINREIYCDQLDAQIKELTTYNGLSKTELLLVAENILKLMELRYNRCEDLVAASDFLLLLDAVNGLARTGTLPSKEFREKYIKTLKEMLNDLINTEGKEKNGNRNGSKEDNHT